MSAISSDEVARVAALARVALSPQEVERLAGELDAVASSFARVTSVVTPDLPATSHPVPLTNVLRPDEPGPVLDVEELLAGAPAAEDSMFLVPQILGEESAS
ncbi:Asp-tRNA(Asn)/Glu-tRNA(Gln) amidotransferase subunit GatC [Actinomyces slackii]|uniref:Aspartyl/glutamyl-tRNA(Asn/Gln) amidotransferase subunit C n=1 Tax=Actinomyces slackii TaxID=52774 RepID=A0A3S4WGY0_9ACTO|nr:Asp-tRNA(Asn)/Glu-tRNA(Gln) amidotransferase subunit GatC [Actinomyces slackii]VEG74660.1 Aspartyl/glutamyl-tRNA(Asn/Gln) amidotransferase subunit C [Actinomyces slackii]